MTTTFEGLPDEGLQVIPGGPPVDRFTVGGGGVLRNASRYLEGSIRGDAEQSR
jgi:hypothetical protein